MSIWSNKAAKVYTLKVLAKEKLNILKKNLCNLIKGVHVETRFWPKTRTTIDDFMLHPNHQV